MAAEASLSSNIGRVLNGRYRLVAPIGSGASAHVLAARDEVLGRRVAIKLLHPALRGDGAFLERFRAEARAAAALSHPNIVAVYDWGEEDEPYLVLEYLAGGSLRELLDAGYRLSPAQAAALGAEVAGALAYAHRRGVVHRDVKPANLLFDDEGRSRVADFGLARALAEAAWTEPLGGLVGTARYASPEQAEGREVDGLADVYALALVLVEAITGEVPFAASTTVATLMARVGVDLAPPAATGPLARVLAAAGRARASERPTSGEVAALLEEVAVSLPPPAPLPLPGRTQTAPRPGPGGTQTAPLPLPGSAGEPGGAGLAPTLVGPPTVPPPSIGQPPAPRHRRRRRRWLYPAAALVVLLAAAGAAYGVHEATLPTYRLPALRGVTVSRAKAMLAGHLRLVVRRQRYDASVPAGQIDGQSPLAGTMLRQGSVVSVDLSRGPAPRPVPTLSGDDEAEALSALTRAGFHPLARSEYSESVPAGEVVSWSPTGVQPYGTTVTVMVSEGPVPRTVPPSQGQTYAQAAQALRALGLYPQREDVYSESVPAGQVVGTVPGAGATVARGSTVTVEVSEGPQLVSVPDVTGDSLAEATAALEQAGLALGVVSGPAGGQVISQAPTAGSEVPAGTTVTLSTGSAGGPGGKGGGGGPGGKRGG